MQAKAQENPQKYIEHHDYDSVDFCDINGLSLVVDCPCGKAARYIKFIEVHAEELAEYLAIYFTEKRVDAEREAKTASELTEKLTQAQGKL